MRVGDIVVAGSSYGKIRALVDDKGKQVKKAGPSIPVEIMGLSEVPSAGDTLMVVSDERVAREAAAKRSTRRQEVRIAAAAGPRVSLESFMLMPTDGGNKTLNLILKADGQGAVEALRSRVEGLSNAEVDIRVIYAGVGGITPNDVNLASASNAVLIGFNIRPDETVKRLAENEQVDIRFYKVIYDVENDLKKAMVGMLAPKFREIVLGRAEVREVFKVSKVGTIAGCYVQSGKLTRNAKVRILRDSAVIFESELESLRRFKDDVREVRRELRVRRPDREVLRSQGGRRDRSVRLGARRARTGPRLIRSVRGIPSSERRALRIRLARDLAAPRSRRPWFRSSQTPSHGTPRTEPAQRLGRAHERGSRRCAEGCLARRAVPSFERARAERGERPSAAADPEGGAARPEALCRDPRSLSRACRIEFKG